MTDMGASPDPQVELVAAAGRIREAGRQQGYREGLAAAEAKPNLSFVFRMFVNVLRNAAQAIADRDPEASEVFNDSADRVVGLMQRPSVDIEAQTVGPRAVVDRDEPRAADREDQGADAD